MDQFSPAAGLPFRLLRSRPARRDAQYVHANDPHFWQGRKLCYIKTMSKISSIMLTQESLVLIVLLLLFAPGRSFWDTWLLTNPIREWRFGTTPHPYLVRCILSQPASVVSSNKLILKCVHQAKA